MPALVPTLYLPSSRSFQLLHLCLTFVANHLMQSLNISTQVCFLLHLKLRNLTSRDRGLNVQDDPGAICAKTFSIRMLAPPLKPLNEA
jgi:hypothetical protein